MRNDLDSQNIDMYEHNLKYSKLAAFMSYWLILYIFSAIILFIFSYVTYGHIDIESFTDKEMFHVSIATNFYAYLTIFILFAVILRKYYLKELRILKSDPLRIIGFGALFWLAGMVVLMIINAILINIFGFEQESENQNTILDALKDYQFYIIMATVVFAPIIEETVFRGIIFQFFEKLKLKRHLNTFLAFFISSSLFGLIHVMTELQDNFLTGLLFALPYIGLGLIMASVYYYTKSLVAVIITHFIQNAFSIVITLYFPSITEPVELGMTKMIEFITLLF